LRTPPTNKPSLEPGDKIEALHEDMIWYCGVVTEKRSGFSDNHYRVLFKDEDREHLIYLLQSPEVIDEAALDGIDPDACFWRPCSHEWVDS